MLKEQQLEELEAELHKATAVVNKCRCNEEENINKLAIARSKVVSCRKKLRDAYSISPHIIDGVMPDHTVDTEDIDELCKEFEV